MPRQTDKQYLRVLRETWDDVTTMGMTEEEAQEFKQKKEAIDLYIDGVDISYISAKTHISKSRICQLVNRCANPLPNTGEIPGYAGLIPRKILKPAKTKMDCFFDTYPQIRAKISGIYFGDKAYTDERRTNLRTLHGIFIRECRLAGVQNYEYPFTTKDFGYEALRVYIKNLRETEMKQAIKREGKDQRQKFLSTGYGPAITLVPLSPYEQVQADGHILDILYTVETIGVDGIPIKEVATRMWLFAIIDVATRCIIGYSISPHINYNRFDLLEAVKNSIIPHEHKPFKLKSLTYPEKGGFPSEVIPECRYALFNTIMLDNAKAHLVSDVEDKLVNELKCVVNYGSVATPESRGIVERFFGTLERSGFHRLPNTTGSNSKDLKREDAEKHAKQIGLTYDDVCEIVEFLIADYNNSAHSALDGHTPLEMMALKVQDARMPVHVVPQKDRAKLEELTHFTLERTLRGGYETGCQPRVNYLSATYIAEDLMIPQSMANEKVIIQVNPSDLRTVKMFRNDGSFFCMMRAVGQKGRIKHSLKTRLMSNKARKARMTPDTIFNPDISSLTEELKERGKKDRRSRTKAATIIREAEGALDRKEPAKIVEIADLRTGEPTDKSRRKAVGENHNEGYDMSPEEILEMTAVFSRHQGNPFAAIEEIEQKKKG